MYRALPPASSLPALHLGADNSPGAGVAPALHYSWPQGPKPSGVTHMEKQPTHSRLTVTSSAGTWGCLWLQQPVAAGLTGLQAAPFPPWHLQRLSLPHHSGFWEAQGACAPPHSVPASRASPALRHGTQVLSSPRLQTCGQAGTPLPEMSLKRFRELIPSLLNAWKLLMLNLYRHN